MIVLDGIAVETVDPDRPIELYPQLLAKQLGVQLTESDQFAGTPAQVPPGRAPRPAQLELIISYYLAPEPDGKTGVAVAVEARAHWRDGRGGLAPHDQIVGRRILDQRDASRVPGVVAGLVGELVSEVGKGLIAKERLRAGADREVLAALRRPEPHLTAWALELAAHRRLSAALELAIGHLRSNDSEVRGAAIATLVALGDRRAVAPLTHLAQFHDHELLRTVLEALTAIGGAEALEYLEFVASGHPDDDIKRRAQEGIARIHKRGRSARSHESASRLGRPGTSD